MKHWHHLEIESIGVERAVQTIQKAELILYIFDISITSYEAFEKELKDIHEQNSKAPLLILANKYDLVEAESKLIDERFQTHENLLFVSTHKTDDVSQLKEKMLTRINQLNSSESNHVVSNARHYEALQKSHQSLDDVLRGMAEGVTSDFVAMDIRQALHHLGEIVGEVSTDDLLGNIFSNFCIGK